MEILIIYVLPLIASILLAIYFFTCTNEEAKIFPFLALIMAFIPGFNTVGFMIGFMRIIRRTMSNVNYIKNNKFNKLLFGR